MPLKVSEYSRFDHFQVKELEAGIVVVTINRPKRGNSFDQTTWTQYGAILSKLDNDGSVKVIILNGTGKNFSAGLDLGFAGTFQKQYAGDSPEEKLQKIYGFVKQFQHGISKGASIGIPIISVSQGASIGLALDILATTSIRIATSDSVFSIREIQLGFAADIGSLQRLPGLFSNKSVFNELALTGRNFGAKEARALGFISKIAPNLDAAFSEAVKVAQEINKNQSVAIRGTKESVRFILEGGSVEQGLENIAVYNGTNLPDLGSKRKSKL